MDIGKFDSIKKNQESGVFIDILDPIEQSPIGLRIKIAGFESERVEAEQVRIQREHQQKGVRQLTLPEMKDRNYRIQAAAIVDWEWAEDASINGEKPRCTPEAALALVRRFPWIGEQIDAKAGVRSTFLSN